MLVNLSDRQVDELRKLAIENHVIKQIIDGIDNRQPVGKPKIAPTAQIYSLRKSGYTQEQIAQQTGVSLSTVRRELAAVRPDSELNTIILQWFTDRADRAAAAKDNAKLAQIMTEMEREFKIPAMAQNIPDWQKRYPNADEILALYRKVSQIRLL